MNLILTVGKFVRSYSQVGVPCFCWPVDQVMLEHVEEHVSGLRRIWKNPIKHTDTLFAVPLQSPSLCPSACWQQHGVQSCVCANVCVCVRMDGEAWDNQLWCPDWGGIISQISPIYLSCLTSSCITMLIHWYCDFDFIVNNKPTLLSNKMGSCWWGCIQICV